MAADNGRSLPNQNTHRLHHNTDQPTSDTSIRYHQSPHLHGSQAAHTHLQTATTSPDVVWSTVPKLYNTKPTDTQLEAFANAHDEWSGLWTPTATLPLTQWMQHTLDMCLTHLGPGTGRKAPSTPNLWHWPLGKKEQWSSQVRSNRHQIKRKARPLKTTTIHTVRSRIKRKKEGLFAPIAEINNAQGETVAELQAMDEFARQMERKRSPLATAGPLATTQCPSPTDGVSTYLKELAKAIQWRREVAPGIKSMTALIFKSFHPHAINRMADVINATTSQNPAYDSCSTYQCGKRRQPTRNKIIAQSS